MPTQETYHSLCVTIRHKNSHTELLRLADIIFSKENSGATGGRFFPFNKDSDLSQVKTISMDPYGAKPNELRIWEWELQPNNSNKQHSYRTDETFYELIFLNNPNLNYGLTIKPLPIWHLFDTLLNGFIAPPQHSDSFLLVVNQTETEYICLEITKSSYNYDKNKIKVHENTLLKVYKISKSYVIDTNEYLDNLDIFKDHLDPVLQRRIVYKRRDIWGSPVATLPLNRFSIHLGEYLRQAATRLSGQTGDQEVIEAFIETITENVNPDSDLIKFFEECSQSNSDTYVSTLEKYPLFESVFTSYLKQTKTDEKFLEFIVEHFPSIRQKYLQILTEGYLDEEKRKLELQLAPLKAEIGEADNELKKKKILKNELNAKIISLTESSKKTLAQVNEAKRLNQDLDELLNGKRTGLLQELSVLKKVLHLGETNFEKSSQNANAPNLTIRPENNLEYMDEVPPEEITQLLEMYSFLQDNLPEQGKDTPDLSELSKFISASYLSRLPLLCAGNSANEMARIISISFNNQVPDTVCVPTGYNNYSSLLSTIRNLKSDIVILENAVGYCDEYCYTHLAEDIPEKYFIFVVEYEETLKILPKGIFAHMGLILCDKFFTTQLMNDEETRPGKITGSISSPPNSATRIKLLKNISNLTLGSPVSTGYVNSRVKILEAIAQEGDQISELIKTIYTEFASIIEIYGISEEYKDELLSNNHRVVLEFKERLGVETE
ncbi:MAG: hypothetical protein PHQ81_02930 [Methanofollis sp.]|nr:hypothetical protein [Methanofollis sp.]